MENEKLKSLIIDDSTYSTFYTKKFSRRKKYISPDPKKILAFIPGVIKRIYVKEGQIVKWGDSLLVLEAMKMQNDVTSPQSGTIKKIHIKTGDMVTKNQLLIEFV